MTFKRFILLIAVSLCSQGLMAQLAAGDIAFIGYNTDGGAGTNDNFAFITLTDIPGSEVIFLTEEGWDNLSSDWVGTSEGHLTYTAPPGGLPCGTVVHINETGTSTFTVTGGGTAVLSSGSGWSLSGGDQVIAYQAASAEPATTPTFIAGVHGDDGNGSPVTLDPVTKWNDSDLLLPLGTARSEVPAGLTNGTNCVSLFPAVGTEQDNAKYTGTLTGTSTTLRALINDYTNWSTDNSTAFAIDPGDFSPSVTCVAPCTDPDVPTITSSPAVICDGDNALLTISGDKNDATAWHVYTGSCGGVLVGTTAGSSISVTPTAPSTTYFVRGEGGCVSPGSCGTIAVSVTAVSDASFSYGAAAYCVNDTDPTPTITGAGGGTFTSGPGLSINASTGEIDVSASTPGTYSITYTAPGSCPGSESVTVTINALDDASFSYSAASYCVDDSDPTPTITGLGGGTFAAGGGLSLNASTGEIDVSASTPGTYTVTYTTAGTCPNSSNASVTINALDDATFNYGAASYCADDADPTPTITGLGGGAFSAGPGLAINASTGAIDVSASTPGTYTVTYTTSGSCPNSSTVSVTINALDDASYNYSAASYCVDDTDPTPTITGLGGGTFSAGGGLSLNTSTGEIDVSASTPGTYTVTYTTTGTCPNSSDISVTINALDDATFNYGAASYCADDADPTPTITGLGGGTFSAGPGLAINASTGAIDVSASTPGSYTITYTTSGSCPNSSTASVTINALDDASFSYDAPSYCISEPDPIPTITGLGGGTFAAGGGLSLNTSTGEIDVSASTPGTYAVTYTTAGTCPNSSDILVTINTLDDASFSYSAAAFCVDDADPTPSITGVGGGTFSAGAGLSINPTTGGIDVSASTPGSYTVTYTTIGVCSNSADVSVTINALDDATFSYDEGAYCADAADPTPTISGLGGGSFSAGAGLSINTSTGAIDLSASTPGTYTVTYTTTGSCPNNSSETVTVNALDDASFSYDAASYCVDDTDPLPTVSGLAGGTFSAGAGLSIDAASGEIDVSVCTPGTYTVTYTTTGICPNASGVSVTINELDDASFSYDAAEYCVDDADPVPAITGLGGGSFSAGAGLSINPSTGAVDVSASTPGTYTVTYTTSGSCPNTSTESVTINALDDASFNYSAADFCVDDTDPTPTVTGLGGGTFSAGPGLSINTSSGEIDVSASTPGTYSVTYTTAGTCPNATSVPVTINALDDASFNYSAGSYCVNDTDPTPTITGLGGGTFATGAGLSLNPSTGAIDVSASTPGTYTVTYTTAGTCPNSSSVLVTINDLDDASFTYSAANYCIGETDPIPSITGLSGGTFTAGPGLSLDPTTGEIDVSASTLGTYTVTYTTAGTCPNSSDFSVTINDLDDASFIYDAATYCPNGDDPTPTITGIGGGTFSAAPVGLSINISSGEIDLSASTPGTYTVTYTTVGTCANSSSVAVSVEDDTDPVPVLAVLPDITAECEITELIDPTATDNCGGLITVTNDASLPITDQGTTVITWTYEDENGNTSTQTQNVIINDITPPIPDIDDLDDLTAECEITELIEPTATDNCGGTITVTNDASLPITDQGTTVVTWTYDDGNGNTSTQTQNIIIDDITAPVADLADLDDITAECEVTELSAPTATDNCGGIVTVSNDASLPITDQGTTVITWTYDDGNGNTSTQTQNVIIDDITPPTIEDCLIEDLIVTANLPGCEAAALWDVPTATDNCADVVMTSTHAPGDIFPSGTTTVTYTATDVGLNEATCSFNIVVQSGIEIDGVITDEEFGGDGAIDLTVTGEGEDPTFSYDWDIDGTGDFDDTEDLSDLTAGTYIVTVMNEFGCTATDTFIVELSCIPLEIEVSDFELCQNELLTLDATSESGADISWDGGATDGIPFMPGETGLITYTANSADPEDCPAEVEILVLSAPIVVASAGDGEICEGDVVVLAAGGDADVFTWDPLDLTPPVGLTDYILTGVDTTNGCSNNDTTTVTVYALPDVSATADQEAICLGDEVTLNGSGAIDYVWDPETITDGVPFNPGGVGLYTYTVTGIDENGCQATDDITIEVVETITITFTTTNEMMGGDGSVDITVAGGLPPYSFDWDNDGTGDFDDPEDLTDLTGGTYTVNVIGEAGCSHTAVIIIQSELSLNDQEFATVNVYPNPTRLSFFTIETSAVISEIWLTDMSGKQLTADYNTATKQVLVNHLDPGTYILTIKTQEGQWIKRSVVLLK